MKEQGTVSIWFGALQNAQALHQYMEEQYTDDNEGTSGFMTDFGIEYYDVDAAEVLFTTGNKQTIFKGFSYSESFIDDLPEIDYSVYNSFILLYNFRYQEAEKQVGNVYFGGTFKYAF